MTPRYEFMQLFANRGWLPIFFASCIIFRMSLYWTLGLAWSCISLISSLGKWKFLCAFIVFAFPCTYNGPYIVADVYCRGTVGSIFGFDRIER